MSFRRNTWRLVVFKVMSAVFSPCFIYSLLAVYFIVGVFYETERKTPLCECYICPAAVSLSVTCDLVSEAAGFVRFLWNSVLEFFFIKVFEWEWVWWKLGQRQPWFTQRRKWIYLRNFHIYCPIWVEYGIVVLFRICEFRGKRFKEGRTLLKGVN